MRKQLFLILSFTFLLAGSNLSLAAPSKEPVRPTTSNKLTATDNLKGKRSIRGIPGDLIPLSAPAFDTRNEAVAGLPTVREESNGLLRYYGNGLGPQSEFLQDVAGDEPRKRKYLPVLLSLLVPGAGELYMGYYVRGAALVGVEVIAWTGYAINHDKGLDSRHAYERFADEHWDYDKWIFDHRAVRDLPEDDRTFDALYEIGETTWNDWPGFHSWHSKEEEKQNYYENIGKYDWFISGWEDWQWDDVANPDDPPRNTALRDQYRAMRKKSNDQLDDAQKFIYLSLAARVFSLVETVLLVRKDSGGENPAETKKFTIGARATGLRSGKVELKLKW